MIKIADEVKNPDHPMHNAWEKFYRDTWIKHFGEGGRAWPHQIKKALRIELHKCGARFQRDDSDHERYHNATAHLHYEPKLVFINKKSYLWFILRWS